MSTDRLLTVGEAMVRLSTQSNEPLVAAHGFDVSVGGAELNVAIAASQMGLPSAWMSRLPDDALGEKIIQHAQRFGVETIVDVGPERVGLYFAEIAPEPRGVTVTYDREYSGACAMTADNFDLTGQVQASSCLYSSGITFALGEGSRELVKALFSTSDSVRRYFEVNHRSKLASPEDTRTWVRELLPEIDVLFASSFDLDELLGLGSTPQEASQKAIAEFGLEWVVVSDRKGRVGGIGSNRIQVFGPEMEVSGEAEGRIVDPIGAGDAGAGAFIACLEEAGDPAWAAQQAVRASAWKQTHFGDAACFQRKDIVEFDERRIRR